MQYSLGDYFTDFVVAALACYTLSFDFFSDVLRMARKGLLGR